MTANDGGVGSSGDNQTYKLYRHLKTLTDHENVVSCVKFSNNGTLLASTKPHSFGHLPCSPSSTASSATLRASPTWLGPQTLIIYVLPLKIAPSAFGTPPRAIVWRSFATTLIQSSIWISIPNQATSCPGHWMRALGFGMWRPTNVSKSSTTTPCPSPLCTTYLSFKTCIYYNFYEIVIDLWTIVVIVIDFFLGYSFWFMKVDWGGYSKLFL